MELDNETQPSMDIATDQLLNVKKAREAPYGHPQPAGQAGCLNAIRERASNASHVTSGRLTSEDADASAAAADIDLLLGSADELDGPFLLLSGANTVSLSALLLHSTAAQEESPAPLAGQLRRNVEHFSGALVSDRGVVHVAEKVGANLDVMKREHVWLRDHRGKS